MTVLTGAFMLLGLGYLVVVVVGLGDRVHADRLLERAGADRWLGAGHGGASMALAAFMAVYGAVGVVGLLTGRSGWALALIGLAAGYGAARSVGALAGNTYRVPGDDAQTRFDMVGMRGYATTASGAGTAGEIAVGAADGERYAAREINGNALDRGDMVRVVGIGQGYLEVEQVGDQ